MGHIFLTDIDMLNTHGPDGVKSYLEFFIRNGVEGFLCGEGTGLPPMLPVCNS